MTVAELMNELRRMPAHHVVLVEFPDRNEMKPFGFAPEIGSIAAVNQEYTQVVLHVPGGIE